MPFISDLRSTASTIVVNKGTSLERKQSGGIDEKEKSHFSGTIPNAPQFYEKDMKMWESKFKKSIEERASFKKQFLKAYELRFGTMNTNTAEFKAN